MDDDDWELLDDGDDCKITPLGILIGIISVVVLCFIIVWFCLR